MAKKYIYWFSEISKEDVPTVGGKGANLGEMYNAGFPIPPGFVVGVEAYFDALERSGIKEEIKKILESLDVNDTKALFEASNRIQSLIRSIEMPEEIRNAIVEAYRKLCEQEGEEVFVAVRSSATAEDIKEASFAGQQATFLNIRGEDALIEAVKGCWASLFTARAIFYREQHGFDHLSVGIAVVVQKMVQSEVSGVMFTKHPVTGENIIIIEAVYGLGEGIVSGKYTPDHYEVDPATWRIVKKEVAKQTEMIAYDPEKGCNVEKPVPLELQDKQKLPDDKIIELAKIGLKIEEHYKFPQDIEWAYEKGKIYIVQSRPVTTIKEEGVKEEEIKEMGELKVILKGLAASPGIAAGPVKIVLSIEELDKVNEGDILVTTMTNPDMVPAMKRAAAIVTDEGGITCLHGDTILLTNYGFMTARDIYNLLLSNPDIPVYLLSYDYKREKFVFRRIIAAGRRKANNIVTIQLFTKTRKHSIDTIKITEDHKFYTFNSEGEVEKIPLIDIYKEGKGVLVPEYIPPLGEEIHIPKLAYILGLIITDGYIKVDSRRGVVVLSQALVGRRRQVAERFIRYVTELTGKTVRIYKKQIYYAAIDGRAIRSCEENYNIVLYSKLFASYLSSAIRHLDLLVLKMDRESLLHFLAGVIDGDGSYNEKNRRINIYLGKKKKIGAVVLALLRLGIHPKVIPNRNIYNIQIYEKLWDLLRYTVRFCDCRPEERKKFRSTRFFVARQVLAKYVDRIGYKGRLKVYIRDDRLVSDAILEEIISEGKRKGVNVDSLISVISKPFRMYRVKIVRKEEEDYVYNFEVDADEELDKNYVIFTDTFTPVLVSNSHAAIVSRELGIPCVVGTKEATKKLKDGMIITVDGTHGVVYEGDVTKIIKKEEKKEAAAPVIAEFYIPTATKIYVNISDPDKAQEIARLPADGVGLLRAEFIVADWIGEHPLYAIEQGRAEEFVNKLAEGIAKVARAFYPRPVVYRSFDFKTNEYRNLKGGEKYEPEERNPMIGFRGAIRAIKQREIFELELKALKKVREEYGLKNVWLMIPFVRTLEEIKEIRRILDEWGFTKDRDFKLWMMVEVPSTVFLIDEFLEYVDGVSIGSNDLTQLILGIDRDNELLAEEFDERNPAVLRAIAYVIKKCREKGKTCSICGQAPSVYPEFCEFLVRHGITSISVNPDRVVETRKLVASIEKKIILEKLLEK